MTTLEKVEQILKLDQRYRNSDKLLLMAFWHTEGFRLSEQQAETFMNATTAETITRARRALKEKYPASEEVNEHRYSKFKQYKQGALL